MQSHSLDSFGYRPKTLTADTKSCYYNGWSSRLLFRYVAAALLQLAQITYTGAMQHEQRLMGAWRGFSALKSFPCRQTQLHWKFIVFIYNWQISNLLLFLPEGLLYGCAHVCADPLSSTMTRTTSVFTGGADSGAVVDMLFDVQQRITWNMWLCWATSHKKTRNIFQCARCT